MRLSIIVAALLLASATAAHAAQDPRPSSYDPRMRYVAYNPGQVVHLSTAVGATMVVGFGPQEEVTAVAVNDSKDLAASPRGHFLFLKSKQAIPLQPVIVLTSSGKGVRRYVFDFMTINAADLGPDAPGIYYSVQFTYPADERAARHAAALVEEARQQTEIEARAAQTQLELAHQQMEEKARDPFSEPRNWHYVAQGDRSILPFEVFDNGFSTVFRFPANVRIPALFVINPDGAEATPNYAVKGDLIQADSVARGWRLRDGLTVLCIWNKAYDAIGRNPGTNTTSPNVQRIVKDAPQ